MRVLLAPMEGVLDPPLREILTRVGNYDLCVSEFIRITDQNMPAKVFHRLCPELTNHSKTQSGTPVRIQLLGNNPETLARSALKAIKLGSPGIDLNFGCPAKTVNKHKGGAILLKEPNTIAKIIETVRHRIPTDFPVTAKMRLGFDDAENTLNIAQQIENAGASELVIHARTKVQGYKPPAHWHLLAEIQQQLSIPVVANGEIWNKEDYLNCIKVSRCQDVMIGRGAVASPFLCEDIRRHQQGLKTKSRTWKDDIKPLLTEFYNACNPDGSARHDLQITGRLKQWLHMLGWQTPEAKLALQQVKRLKTRSDVFSALEL